MSTSDQAHADSAPLHPDNQVTIYINGTPKVVQKERLTFDEIVALAFDSPPTGDGVQFTVQYSRGQSGSKGSLVEGQSVQVKEGMEFDVTPTNRS
ncbi:MULTISPECIES: multiubiquitin domain-containing protein [Paraburkholderia]|uniref:multiubiquitin domain-containing protein n=1 Tax=Paraburkholderia TaxID=1822464 RepID=UPI00225BBBA4|nr:MULTISPECIES: multiubiquitin domain-containing protein [Paraburkholderia]MCX4175653.1 multiubiquitin domain-containing protein [Paraburkholderia madseniana]MDQ6463648.1 multiubiquitin domain-containing protein [Paraburkholderia madseniana]